MKRIVFPCLLLVLCICTRESNAQLGNLKNRVKQKVSERVDRKVDQAIDKSLDKVEDAAKVEPATEGEVKTNTGTTVGSVESKAKVETGIKTYSKYDFVPGEKILYAEDFSQDVIGEFPLKWNTNGGGEIVNVEGLPGKWLKLEEGTRYESANKNTLPENYTIEFDILVNYNDDRGVPGVNVFLNAEKLQGHAYGGQLYFTLSPNNGTSAERDAVQFASLNKQGAEQLRGIKKLHNVFNNVNHKRTPVHVSIWVQKQRFRAWLNQDKFYDLPQGVDEGMQFNKLAFEVSNYGGSKDDFQYFISNIKIGAAMPDTRSKLITEGKWSTTGILFDVNSDKIKPSSYSVLKEIATTLKENADVKVKILGHTDSDGEDARNLDLSKRRAASVKAMLSTEFGIDAARMETDGMGETKPVGDNKSAEGKAQNRRVEFVKL
jgi:outer membrane protein OmpA-like peptidoglycan-associated protein